VKSLALSHVVGMACLVFAALLSGCVSHSTSLRSGGSAGQNAGSDDTSKTRRAQVRMELGSAYFSRGQYATALDEVKQAIAADADFFQAYNLRGLIYAALNDPGMAQESFRKALQLNPRDGDTMHNFGWFLCQRGSYDEAISYFAKAIEQPQYAGTARTLLARGVCEARSGKAEQAEATLMQAYRLDPANPAVAINFAQLLYQRGDYDRARFYIRRVNSAEDQANAQSLWLASRIEMKLGATERANDFGRQLRERFPQSKEASAFDRGSFDE
jgi:type IV pilus assembly protein PilF